MDGIPITGFTFSLVRCFILSKMESETAERPGVEFWRSADLAAP